MHGRDEDVDVGVVQEGGAVGAGVSHVRGLVCRGVGGVWRMCGGGEGERGAVNKGLRGGARGCEGVQGVARRC